METIAVFATVTSIVVQAVKAVVNGRAPDEIYPVVAIWVGVVLALLFKESAMTGLIIGLTSMGTYSGVKNAASGYTKLTEK